MFGGNAEEVLAKYEQHQEELLDVQKEELGQDNPDANIQADEAPIKYHGNGSVGFDTHFDAVKSKMQELKAALHPDTFEVGVWTKLKQELQGNPEALRAQEDELLKKYGSHISVQSKGSRKQKLKAINEKVRFLAEPSGHQTEAADFTEKDIKDVESKGGKGNQYGTVEHGRLILERQVEDRSQSVTDPETGEMSFGKKTKEFTVYAGELVKKMRDAAKRFGFDDSLNDQNVSTALRHLKAGLSSLINTGEFTGRIGYRTTPDGEVLWIDNGELPRNLNIFPGLSVADAKKAESVEAAKRGNKTDYAEKINELTGDDGKTSAATYLTDKRNLDGSLELVPNEGKSQGEGSRGVKEKTREEATYVDEQGRVRKGERAMGARQEGRPVEGIGRRPLTVPYETEEGQVADNTLAAEAQDPQVGRNTNASLDRDMLGQAIPERDIAPTVGKKQIRFITELLSKGVPAFVAKVKAMTEQQRFKTRAALRELVKTGRLEGDLTARAENALKALRGAAERKGNAQSTIYPKTDEEIANEFESTEDGIKRGDVRAVLPERQTLGQRYAVKIAGIFGKRVVYLERKDGGELLFNGATLRNKFPEVIFLNHAGEFSARFSMGHELAHHLQRADPKAFASLVAKMESYINIAERDEFYADMKKRGLTGEQAQEEMISNLFGDFVGRKILPKNSKEILDSEQGLTKWRSARFSTDLTKTDKLISDFLNVNRKASAQSATGESITPEQQAKLREQMVKTLGDKIKLGFAKLIKGNKKGETWSGEHTEGMIRIALNALNPSGVLDHEMMHEFFAIMKGAGAQDVIDLMKNVATNKLVNRQLHRLLRDDPAAQKQLSDPEEAAAYLYQFWQMGKVQLGPKSEGLLQSIGNFLAKIFGLVSQEVRDQQHAAEIMAAFGNGVMAKDAQVGAEAISKLLAERRGTDARKFLTLLKNSTMLSNAVFTASNVLRDTDNPYFIKIADLFHQTVGGKTVGQDLYRATAQYRNKYLNSLHEVLDGVDKEDLPLALEHLQNKTPTGKIVDPEIQRIVNGEG